MSLAQGNNTPTRPRIEPGSPDPESDALTTRPVRPFILAGSEDIHKSLNEFEFRPDSTTDSIVTCPEAAEKLKYNRVNTLSPSFSIGSYSFFQVMRKTIRSRTSSKFGQIGQWTAEVSLGVWKNPHRLIFFIFD